MNVEEEVPVGHFKAVKRNPKRDIGTYIYRSTRSDSTIIIMDMSQFARGICKAKSNLNLKVDSEKTRTTERGKMMNATLDYSGSILKSRTKFCKTLLKAQLYPPEITTENNRFTGLYRVFWRCS